MRDITIMVSLGAFLLSVCVIAAEDEAPQEPIAVAEQTPSSHHEVDPLDVEFGRLSALCLDRQGNLLAGDAEAEEIKVIDAAGKQTRTLKPGFAVYAIDVAPDGTIYCGGLDKVAMLDASGKVLKTTTVEEESVPPGADSPDPPPRSRSRVPRVSGIAVSGRDVFVAFGSGWSLRSRSKLFRYDRQLDNPKLIAEGLRGCCQRCDVAAHGGVLYLAENSAFRVVKFDREGEQLGKWGSRDRKAIEGFGACCNPMNIYFDAKGNLYTAESGLGRVKCYTRDGEFLGLVGYVGVDRFDRAGHFAASCSNIAIAVTPDGSRVYVMDYRNNVVRVLQK